MDAKSAPQGVVIVCEFTSLAVSGRDTHYGSGRMALLKRSEVDGALTALAPFKLSLRRPVFSVALSKLPAVFQTYALACSS